MKIVIGSGPSGVACTEALLAGGDEVLMLDAGIEKDPPRQDLLSRIKAGDDDAFRQLKALHSHLAMSPQDVPLKLAYGSDFSYRGAEDHLGFQREMAGILPSLARGGLSTVWGAAMLPYRRADMADWPITPEDLAAHYRAVLEMTGCSAREDDLAEWYPLHTERLNELNPSSQARTLLAGLDRNRNALRRDGILFGSSRLAIGPNRSQVRPCVYCGQCLYGCPHEAIYNSEHDLLRFRSEAGSRFIYQGDTIVDRITEDRQGVHVLGYDRLTRAPVHVEGQRAFVAAGPLPSSRIVLKSLEAYDRPVTLLDSQYFVLPLLSLAGAKAGEALHTLSQVFLEIEDQKISPYTIHLQIYTHNDLIAQALKARFQFLPGWRRLLVPLLERRLIVIQGYLHSAHSGTMELRLSRDRTGRERLVVKGHPRPEAREKIAQVLRKLSPHFRRLGLLAVHPGLDITRPGRGFHAGGSFPMRRQPGDFESDLLGCVGGTSRTHLVDASIFPSIPATTITLAAMANAHRIGSTVPLA